MIAAIFAILQANLNKNIGLGKNQIIGDFGCFRCKYGRFWKKYVGDLSIIGDFWIFQKNFNTNLFVKNQKSTFSCSKKELVANHFSEPKYRRFWPKRASYIGVIRGFVSYIEVIEHIGALAVLKGVKSNICIQTIQFFSQNFFSLIEILIFMLLRSPYKISNL